MIDFFTAYKLGGISLVFNIALILANMAQWKSGRQKDKEFLESFKTTSKDFLNATKETNTMVQALAEKQHENEIKAIAVLTKMQKDIESFIK